MPACLRTSGSVRQTATPQVATRAPEVHTLWPSSTQFSPSRTALVRTAARSEPASVSEKSWQASSSVRSMGRSQRRFCSSEPQIPIAGATSCWVTGKTSVRCGTSKAASSAR